MGLTLDRLLDVLVQCWDEDTTQNPDGWDPDRPAAGQCAVSSMVIQSYFGGELLRGVTNKGTVHYWNQLDNGAWVDATRSQFDPDELITEYVVRPPDYLYKFQDTVDRYMTLLGRVQIALVRSA